MGITVGDSVNYIASYANQYQTAGNAAASETAARALEKDLGIQFTAAQFDAVKTTFMNGHAGDPTAGLPPPDDTRGASGSSLGAFDSGGVQADIYSCMALFQKLAQEMRNSAREQRGAEAQAKFDSQMSAADKMQDAADKRYEAGIASGWSQIAGGIMQVGAAGASLGMGIKGANSTGEGSKMVQGAKDGAGNVAPANLGAFNKGTDMMTSGSKWTAGAQATGQAAGGLSGIATGAGQIIAAGYTKEADYADAAAKRKDAEATAHDTAMQHANDMMQQMMDVIRDVRDKLQSIEQAAIETNKGIARNV